MASFVGAGLEHGCSRCLDLRKRRPPGGGCEVSDEERVDDVTGPIVDRERWFVQVGDGMEFLCDLEAHDNPDEGVRVWQAESTLRSWFDRLEVVADAGLVR
ncbi:hypothetical protein [Nocardia fluminea]|uniref:hypothetical protein n=1 Tax=Nocardia fluminea TaxID=134984 RepID=UPI0037902F75